MGLHTIFFDLHGTVVPESSEILYNSAATQTYFETVKTASMRLQQYCLKNNIKLGVVSSGTIIEAIEATTKLGLTPDIYYVSHGAMRSYDAGKTWSLTDSTMAESIRYTLHTVENKIKQIIQPAKVIQKDFTMAVVYNAPLTKHTHDQIVANTSALMSVYVLDSRVHYFSPRKVNKQIALADYYKNTGLKPDGVLFYGNSTNDYDVMHKDVEHKTLLSTSYTHTPTLDTRFEQQVLPFTPLATKPLLYGLLDFLNITLE